MSQVVMSDQLVCQYFIYNFILGPFDLDMSGVNDGEREIINKILKRRFDNQTKAGASKHTGSVVAVNRLLRELNSLYKSQGYKDRESKLRRQ